MSWLSKGLKSARKAVTHPREWLSNAAKTASVPVGFVNPALGVGLAAAGGAMQKGGNVLGNTLKSAAPAAVGALTGGAGKGLSLGGGWGDKLRSVGGWALDNPDVLLSGASMIQGAMQQGQADKMNRRALDLAETPWRETAGLRSVMLDRAINPRRPDLSGTFANSSNPFA